MVDQVLQNVEPRLPRKEICGIAILLAIGWFFFQGNVGFHPEDEGYLWYDSLQTRAGSVPVRDFRSYDPGRYYWTAGWFLLLGESYYAFRLSLTVVQAIGLLFGLLLLRKMIGQRWLLVIFGIMLLLWMFPRNKCFEHTLVLGMLYAAAWLIDKPDLKRHFASGVMVGAAALFGKNLGVYFFFGFFPLILFLGWTRGKIELLRDCAAFSAGLIVGYMPMICMMLFVPGFFAGFADSILRLFGPYAPVKHLPIPWPWEVAFSPMKLIDKIRRLSEGTAFIALFAFCAIGLANVLMSKKPFSRATSLLAASVFIGLPLLHHVCVRADDQHLSQGVHPLLIGLAAIVVSARIKGRKILAFMAILLIVTLTAVPVLFSVEAGMAVQKMYGTVFKTNRLARYEITRNTFWLPRAQAFSLGKMTRFLSKKMSSGDSILIAPYAPGLYCLLGKKSPIWDPYPIHLAPFAEQMKSIREMESLDVRWALIDTTPLDNIKERSFPCTHEWVWRYIQQEFAAVFCPGLAPGQIFFHKTGY
jgi:hypothetical protein